MTPKKRTPKKKAEVAVREDAPVKVASQRVDGGPGTALAVREAGPMRATAGTHTIRTTFRPDLEITVSDAEYEALLDLGVVYDGTAPNPVADPFDARVAEFLAVDGSSTQTAVNTIVTAAVTGAQDPYVAGLVADDASDTAVALRAAFVTLADDQVVTGTKLFQGAFAFGPDPTGKSGLDLQLLVKDDTHPWPNTPSASVFELLHNGTQGNIFHLTNGASVAPNDAPALIALGVDSNRTGLYVHMRGDYGGGTGIKISVDSTNGSGHYGMLVSGGMGGSPAVWLQQNNLDGSANAQSLAVFFAYRSFGASQKLVEFRKPGTGVDGTPYSGTLTGFVRSQDGALVWTSQALFQPADVNTTPVVVTGLTGQATDLQQWAVTGTGTVARVDKSGSIFGTTLYAQTAGASLNLYDTGGGANSRRFKLSQNSGSVILSARNDDDSSKKNLLVIDQSGNQSVPDAANFVLGTTTGTKLGTAATQKLGFFGATPVVQPSGTPAAATDLASVIALANSLRSSLLALGAAA